MIPRTPARTLLAPLIFGAALATADAAACDRHLHSRATDAAATLQPLPSRPGTNASPDLLFAPLYEAPATGGMRIWIDPETGTLAAPPATHFEALSTRSALTPEDLVPELAWDGSLMVDLRGLFQEYAVVRLDARGGLSLGCGPDPLTLLRSPLPARLPSAEE